MSDNGVHRLKPHYRQDKDADRIYRGDVLEAVVVRKDDGWHWERLDAKPPHDRGVAATRGEAYALMGYKFREKT